MTKTWKNECRAACLDLAGAARYTRLVMILVFAPFPVLERVALVEQFVPGTAQKPMRVATYAGGAGLRAANVARLLKADVLALGFVGGHLGALLREGLDRQDIPHVLTPIVDQSGTRGDFLLLDREQGVVTEVPEGAPGVTEGEADKLLLALERHLGGASLLLVADGQRDTASAGQPERFDNEYARHGVVNLFMLFEPLAGRRRVAVRERRTGMDFAHVIEHLVEHLYPQAERIVLVMDNLNTHTPASLYEAFEPARPSGLPTSWRFTTRPNTARG